MVNLTQLASEARFAEIRKTCKHPNAYFKDVSGVDYCPSCHSLRVHGFRNKITKERVGNAISVEMADSGMYETFEEWVPSPGLHENFNQYVSRQQKISRAFGEDYFYQGRGY